ncbi:MAG: L-serine ammonia-lyase, iron-sulfur-dependent, subunit alpha [Bacillota bacterium]|nr:L-serine ammonia-lyase, iron-sulfur-dependent, subunit alpha [Bacillota bacterium]MDW7678538.1 L-serine ammonia-lyase, iron-sulfur-dependent, subunit alpha [Bacillota bacterium]
MFYQGRQLLDICREQQCSISTAMIRQECLLFNVTEPDIRRRMHQQWMIMQQGIQKAMEQDLVSMGGLIGGEGRKLLSRCETGTSITGPVTVKAMAYAMGLLEVNASMGIIVAAPTAGSCGILPGTLKALQETYDWTDEQIVTALFNAAAISSIIVHQATVSGAEGGCQAETGSAAAMTASAVCELMHADPETCLHAAAISLKNVMGQVCDPVAGLVESPCQKRNGIGAANALISAEMALAGIKSLIPFDEVVTAMGEVGRSLPETLRETTRGGIAVTPTACRIRDQLLNKP